MQSIMGKITAFLKSIAATFGGPGLLIIAFFDSSFLSFPEVNDVIIMTNSFHNPERMLYLASMTVIGSVLGCTALYWVGRRGGHALLHKKFDPVKVARVRRWFDRYGILAVVIPSILPPPTPFKVFVLSAGVFEIKPWKFITAVLFGRSFRYYLEGYLAMKMGEQGMHWMREHYPWLALSMVLTLVGIFAIYFLLRKKHEEIPN